MRVLLIDDSAGIRAITRTLVEQSGCCTIVGEAENAEAAVSAVGEHRPDIVVMDWQMPGHDGIWATRQIKAIFPEVDVLAFTSAVSDDLRRQFADAGAIALFAKPELAALVDWLVNRAGGRTPDGAG